MYDDSNDDDEVQPRPSMQPASYLEQLADRLGVLPASVLIGVCAVVAAVGGAYWALRAPAPPPVEETLAQISDTPIAGATLAPTTTTQPPPLVVHVDGAVLAPGLHELGPSARINDAIVAAGGFSDRADSSRVNLAAPVRDGERIWIPALDEEQAPAVVAGTGTGTGSGLSSGGDNDALAGPINVNTASAAELESLPGIGPALAAAIIEFRERSGPFSEPSALTSVPGIGDAKLAQFIDRVVV